MLLKRVWCHRCQKRHHEPACKPLSVQLELAAFDKLPRCLREALNSAPACIDPRFILGMYQTQGLRDTLDYLEDTGLTTKSIES